jgi:predicted acylesterase/phospholipase RssA
MAMGLTLIRKSIGAPPKRDPKIALVLAGGAITGGAFKVGGLKALDDFMVGRGITELDCYVGLSAGAILAIPLAGGIPPDEMIKVLEGTSEQFDQLRPIDFYNFNWREFASRPGRLAYDLWSYLPGVTLEFMRGLPSLPDSLGGSARHFLKDPTYKHLEALVTRLIEHSSPMRDVPRPSNHIPSGLFDNSSLEQWMRRSLERIEMPNDFRAFQRQRGVELYLSACNLDTSERVVFGADENCEVTIAQAMQASMALPVFYKPARLNGVDYIDGGVCSTANIDVAIEKGADLIICYNPFRPFVNRLDVHDDVDGESGRRRYLANRGLKVVVNQVFRTLLHSRLKLGLQRYQADDRFKGDIVLLEPREHDEDFFHVNPLAFWRRGEAVRHGFESVRDTVERNFDELRELFGHYGIEMSRRAARRKAEQLREERGWDAVDGADEVGDEQRLRLVGT